MTERKTKTTNKKTKTKTKTKLGSLDLGILFLNLGLGQVILNLDLRIMFSLVNSSLLLHILCLHFAFVIVFVLCRSNEMVNSLHHLVTSALIRIFEHVDLRIRERGFEHVSVWICTFEHVELHIRACEFKHSSA